MVVPPATILRRVALVFLRRTFGLGLSLLLFLSLAQLLQLLPLFLGGLFALGDVVGTALLGASAAALVARGLRLAQLSSREAIDGESLLRRQFDCVVFVSVVWFLV